ECVYRAHESYQSRPDEIVPIHIRGQAHAALRSRHGRQVGVTFDEGRPAFLTAPLPKSLPERSGLLGIGFHGAAPFFFCQCFALALAIRMYSSSRSMPTISSQPPRCAAIVSDPLPAKGTRIRRGA